MLTKIQDHVSRRFRALLSGDPEGNPPWLPQIAEGEGRGLFMPDEAPWIVHGDLATLVGGVRALLMQALHPGSLAGVYDHSRYKEDPLGRLAGTIQWLTVTTFASEGSIQREAKRVRAMHQRVRGHYCDAQGRERAYSAGDTELLEWVHIAFMESFLRCHQNYSARPIPGGADAYVRLWAKSVEPLGLESAPQSEAELEAAVERFLPQLMVSDATREVIHWLRRPPLPGVARTTYELLFHAAYVTLPPPLQEMIGIRSLPAGPLRGSTRVFLKMLRIAIGPHDPLQEAAIERLRRSGYPDVCKPA